MRLILLIILLSFTGCAHNGQNPFSKIFGANILVGNSGFVTVKDTLGAPNEAFNIAYSHCAKYKKVAVYKGRGGDSFECSGNNFCKTYTCEKN